MKIAIKHTVVFTDDELKQFKKIYEDNKQEGETFREWYTSRFIADGEACLEETRYNYFSGAAT
jgi:hypothetical protein